MNLGRQWDSRLKIWDEAFEENFYKPLGELAMEGFATMDFLDLKTAQAGTFRPFPPGTDWGKKWEYGWFRCQITIPPEAEGKRIMLSLGVAEEMLVYVDGEAVGSIDLQHFFVEVTKSAVPGCVHEIYAEAYAGHGVRREDGGIFPRGTETVPEPPEAQVTVGKSHYGVWNEEMFSAYADYHTLYDLLMQLPDSSLRGMEIAKALQEFTYAADFELEEPARTESVVNASKLLKPLLHKKNGDTVPEYTVFGQSHLDLAWKWTESETKRKSARTYSNQLKLMERYPEYQFLLCCPTVLENLKQYYPNLYAQVQKRQKEGNFIPEGAVWVECDTNLPGGESLIRQFVKGKRWFMREFGVDSKLAWLPDTFGFSGALPQIMAGCRVPYFATQKLLRSDPECEKFPYNNFWWEGIDGTRVLSHIYFENNARFTPAQLAMRWEKHRSQMEHIDGMIFPFGYGDGGGGATDIMLETYRRCKDLEGLPRCTMDSPVSFFERLEQMDVSEVYYGELYLAWHRGTYTVVAKTKEKVRRAESALREAESLAGVLSLEGRLESVVLDELEKLWDILLLQEFHDVIAGACIRRVNEEAAQKLDEVIERSRKLAEQLLTVLVGEGAVFNSLGWMRKYRGYELPSFGYLTLGEAVDGVDEAAQRQMEGGMDGSVQRQMESGECGKWQVAHNEDLLTIANSFYEAVLDRYGRIVSLKDGDTGYEYAQGPLNELRLYQDVNVCYDAWEIGRMYEKIPVDISSEPVFSFEEREDAAVVSIERKEPYFTWRQKIYFAESSPEICFETEVDWHERHRILKVDFPTSIFTREAIEEIQFGYLKRPTHRSRQYEKDLYETCHHRYAALTDGANGVALINDSKYGLSANDSRLSLTLLRASAVPDMYADQGAHHFTYVLYPFRGAFQYSDVAQKAYEYNTAVTSTVSGFVQEEKELGFAKKDGTISAGALHLDNVRRLKALASHSYFSVEGSKLFIETCKPAMDVECAAVLRLYEPMGMAGSCVLKLPGQVKKVWQCNMLEERQAELPVEGGGVSLRFRAFEIITLLLE